MNGKYLIIFGGDAASTYSENAALKDIYVIDLDEMHINTTKSNIECPIGSHYFGACIMNDGFDGEFIIFGFIRQCWNEYKLSMNKFPPNCIIYLILSWYDRQKLYLMDLQTKLNCSMDIDYILNKLDKWP